MATGLCVLCDKEVTEDDYRREVDCPSKTCPGRIYHEDCIATYLRRTKYSKDRCTGFPCPVTQQNGKPCPGYVCKMHLFHPANQKKKQARLQAAVTAAAVTAPKPKPAPAKAKAGAQAAIAAIKRPTPDGAQPTVVQKLPKPAPNINDAAQQPRLIPGLNGPIQATSARDELRARIASARAEVKAGLVGNHGATGGNAKGATNGGVGQTKKVVMNAGAPAKAIDSDEDAKERMPRVATIWDAFVKAPGDLNIYELERHNRGGKFTARLKKRLEGGAPADGFDAVFDGASSESESVVSSSLMSMNRDGEDTGEKFGGEDFSALPITPSLSPTQDRSIMPSEIFPTPSDTVNMDTPTVEDSDPIHEFDMVFATEDGVSYLVLDNVSNTYVTVDDLYGPACELMECPAEDGNTYLCVVVRGVQLARRAQWQDAWVQSQLLGNTAQHEIPLQQVVPSATEMFANTNTTNPLQMAAQMSMGLPFGGMAAWAAVMPTVPPAKTQDAAYYGTVVDGGVAAGEAPAEEEEDDADVASLMQLLCV